MLKKWINTVSLCILCLTLSACNVGGPGPSDVLNSYLDASLKNNLEEAYGYISTEDKSVKTLQQYLSENSQENNPVAEAMASKTSFQIVNINKEKSTASANVEINAPDFTSIMMDLMGAAFGAAFGNEDDSKIQEVLSKKFKNGDIPMKTEKEVFHLIKEDDGWKVFLDWKTQIAINALMEEAKKLKAEKKLEGAAQKYEKVLALDSNMIDAKKALDDTKSEISSIKEKQSYIKNVVLYDLQAKYYSTYLESNVPGVEFKLKNKGNRTLKKVEVTVYFKDSSGTIIAEKTYNPVLISEYSWNDTKPLKPNYIWQLENGKFYKADSVPSEWKEGAVSAKITDIEFQ